jgi:VanZ family protein
MSVKQITARIQPISPYFFTVLICIITALLLMEHSGPSIGFPHMDKVIHVILFATLTAVGYIAFPTARGKLYVGLMVYGIITEVLQGVLTVTRYASIYDWMADILGIALWLLVINIIKSNTISKTKHVN